MLKELKTFIEVARLGSFARAGEQVGLTQSAISAQMQRLEAHFNIPIFERQGRSACLTSFGRQLLAQAQNLLTAYEQLGRSYDMPEAVIPIKLGAIASIQKQRLPKAIGRFIEHYPNVQLKIVPGVSLNLVNQVAAGELDFAVLIRPPFALQGDLYCTHLCSEPFRLLVPNHLADQSWQQLIQEQPFIRYDRNSFGGRLVDRFLREMHLTVQDVCEVDELDALIALVAEGVGVALVPQTEAKPDWPNNVTALDLGRETFTREIVVVHRPKEEVSIVVNALIQQLIDVENG